MSRPKIRCLFGPRAKQKQAVRPNGEAIDHNPSSSELDTHLEPPAAPFVLPPLSPARHFNVDRVTFTHPQLTIRTPFDRYRASCAPAPRPDPFLIAQRRSGVFAEVLKNLVTQEIDDLLEEIKTSRRHELLEQLPFERRLSKEDCLQMFRNNELPVTGSLAGVFLWATRLEDDDEPNARE